MDKEVKNLKDLHVVDYSNSYILTMGDWNNIRIQIECSLLLIGKKNRVMAEYYLCSNCKREKCFSKGGILFLDNNYDFHPIFTGHRKVIIMKKRVMTSVQPTISIEDDSLFGGFNIHIKNLKCEPADLVNREGLISQVRNMRYLVARNIIRVEEYSPFYAIVEYPVKTINVRDAGVVWYQTDTGPILFPDFDKFDLKNIDNFVTVAFCAFNRQKGANFLIEVPKVIETKNDEKYQVFHFNKRIITDTSNEIYVGLT